MAKACEAEGDGLISDLHFRPSLCRRAPPGGGSGSRLPLWLLLPRRCGDVTFDARFNVLF